jgi:hypothetical protein
LITVINDILDFSKIEAGKLGLESIPFDLRESLGETMGTLGFRAHQKGLELMYACIGRGRQFDQSPSAYRIAGALGNEFYRSGRRPHRSRGNGTS